MKTEYTSKELRRLPGVTYDTLRTWAGRRNMDKNKKNSKHQPVLLSPLRKPGSTYCWVYASDAVERIWWIRMLQMLGFKNEQIEKILDDPDQKQGKELWKSLDVKIKDLRWKIQHLSKAQQFAEAIREVGRLPNFPHIEGVDDIDRYLEVLPVAPNVTSSDYKSGSKQLMKTFGIDRDIVIAQSHSPKQLDVQDEIYHSIRKLQVFREPASSQQVYFFIDKLYKELLGIQGFNLGVFHSIGKLCAKEHYLDDSYGSGFSIFLAEAIFIYCFVQSIRLNEEEQSTEKK